MGQPMTAKGASKLIDRMDAMAHRLLDRSMEGEGEEQPSLASQTDTFKIVADWVRIRDRLDGADAPGKGLDEYRSRLESPPAERAASPGRPGRKPRGAPLAALEGNGGPELAALQSRIPPTNVGAISNDGQAGG